MTDALISTEVASLIPPHMLTAISLRGESLGLRIVINTGVYNRESGITTAEETGQIIKHGRALIANVGNIQTHARRSLCMQQLTGSSFGQLDLHLLFRLREHVARFELEPQQTTFCLPMSERGVYDLLVLGQVPQVAVSGVMANDGGLLGEQVCSTRIHLSRKVSCMP